ncbi:Glycolipid 2-alpha-mannosyltransferase (alpha-1,2-mannosyltransferase) [Pseudoloma neurophilia]|uniref:Glycolipid 2-alpha-mannosyltransferase (Alpha-1,2-mannosyltransferase) n=1 Tax=Pseudoloma neurophilia TaxID=146866 RepID=A0A0R0LT98_9MICR|nr:Glycolipid 2-alpha-mannosyltransferase (alpha-1,2-mannosyltransferase) [Pseudoloma neurophilia]
MISVLLFLLSFFCKENAVIFFLCRNSDIDTLLNVLDNFEDIFNKRYKYPYLFANDQPFTADFIERVKSRISSSAEFIQLDQHEWEVPNWIDQNKLTQSLAFLEQKGIIHGGSLPYRKMCRFFSGFLHKNRYMLKYDYYWRIEPQHIRFLCKILYDPFEYMRRNNIEYGFNMNVREIMETIPSLWEHTINFVQNNKNIISNQKPLEQLIDENGNYTGCHFWTNFEIANLNFFRSEIYQKYFDYLDRTGNFFYERWGDAPVHSLAVGIFLGKRKIHFFDDIGYEHTGIIHCPTDPSMQVNCNCDPRNTIDEHPWSCIRKFIKEDL